jgi:putative SOS response-associated peptidase YedK
MEVPVCGRFTLTLDPADLQDAFPEFTFPSHQVQRYNIAPSQPILTLPNNGTNKADFFIWGLIPSWAKDPSIGNRLINARGETLAEKPAFRSSYKNHRCLIFADGFFEWRVQPGSKTKKPFYIQMKSGAPFAFAGLWENWQQADGSEIRTVTIITTESNELVALFHNRMPVILNPNCYTQWLDCASQSPARLNHLLGPYPADEMKALSVSMLVNSPLNDSAECIFPV